MAWQPITDAVNLPTPGTDESEILELRESQSNPSVGIVSMRCRGINQRREVVIEFKRTFMVYKREAPEAAPVFPGTEVDWTV